MRFLVNIEYKYKYKQIIINFLCFIYLVITKIIDSITGNFPVNTKDFLFQIYKQIAVVY